MSMVERVDLGPWEPLRVVVEDDDIEGLNPVFRFLLLLYKSELFRPQIEQYFESHPKIHFLETNYPLLKGGQSPLAVLSREIDALLNVGELSLIEEKDALEMIERLGLTAVLVDDQPRSGDGVRDGIIQVDSELR